MKFLIAIGTAALLPAVIWALPVLRAGAAPAGATNAAAAVPYKPSGYPNVTYRHVPQARSHKARHQTARRPAWIYVEPGAKVPKGGLRPARKTVLRSTAGRSRGGGVAITVGPDFYPAARAEVKHGKVQFTCNRTGVHYHTVQGRQVRHGG